MKSRICAAAVLLVSAGCIHLEQAFLLNGDGTLVVRYHYSVAEESTELMAAGRQVVEGWQGTRAAAGPDWFTSEAAVRRHFSGPGLRLQQFRSFSEGGRRHVEILVFAENGPSAINSGVFGAFHCERTEDDMVRISADVPKVPAEAARLDSPSVEALCDDLYLQLEFQVPARISSSTAATATRRTATWTFDPASALAFIRELPDIRCEFPAGRLEWANTLPLAKQ